MRIVVVDDTPVNLTVLSHLIAKVGRHESVLFESPQEAMRYCKANPFDLLILDYMMPDLDGLAFLADIRATGNEAPILMVTASFDAAVRYEALERGASDFLNKPVDKVEFIARVRNLLALRESSEALKNRAAWLDTEGKKATASILMRERESIALLCGAAEYRDPETGAHIHRMAHYSRLIAEELKRPLAEQADLLAAAPMHDIGKVGTPDAILLKPGRLTDDEMVIMRRHAKNGYDILSRSDAELLRLGALIALNHHEKFDGSGYPQGLTGEAIPLVGRIVAVADVFDALTSARPYKAAWPLADARAHLEKNRGSHFDPACVDAFLRRWDDILSIREQFQDEEPQQP